MRLNTRNLDLSQVQDRRRMGGGGAAIGGGLGGLGIIVVLLFQLLGGGGGSPVSLDSLQQFPQAQAPTGDTTVPESDDVGRFVVAVTNDVQRTWTEQFSAAGETYPQTKLVLFRDAVSTGCGNATSATGPFYCPADKQVYLDLGFFEELHRRFGAPGDFAQAYVIAHEFGHHVQNVLGIERQVRAAQRDDPDSANELSVRMELQADCFAGIWAHSAFAEGELEAGDVEEGLRAAAAIGDDRIQREAGRRVDPHTFTHGSSEQRQQWFTEGLDNGSVRGCDTFDADL